MGSVNRRSELSVKDIQVFECGNLGRTYRLSCSCNRMHIRPPEEWSLFEAFIYGQLPPYGCMFICNFSITVSTDSFALTRVRVQIACISSKV